MMPPPPALLLAEAAHGKAPALCASRGGSRGPLPRTPLRPPPPNHRCGAVGLFRFCLSRGTAPHSLPLPRPDRGTAPIGWLWRLLAKRPLAIGHGSPAVKEVSGRRLAVRPILGWRGGRGRPRRPGIWTARLPSPPPPRAAQGSPRGSGRLPRPDLFLGTRGCPTTPIPGCPQERELEAQGSSARLRGFGPEGSHRVATGKDPVTDANT